MADLFVHVDTHEPLIAFVERERLDPVVLAQEVANDTRLADRYRQRQLSDALLQLRPTVEAMAMSGQV